jgi:hypothetical protein
MFEMNHDAHTRLSVRATCFYYGIMILFAPIWLPLTLIFYVGSRFVLRRIFSGSIEDAWSRCVEIWSGVDTVVGAEIGPNFETPFAHSIAEHFASYHPKSREFLLRQLQHDDPHLAAYAFKALIRCKPTVHRSDIPEKVLQRADQICTQRFGCTRETISFSKYVNDYFDTSQYTTTPS